MFFKLFLLRKRSHSEFPFPIFLSKNSSKNIIINNIYVQASIHLTFITM